MKAYTIRPTRKGFGIYSGRTLLGRMRLIEEHDRLFEAEQHALHLVTKANHRLLDYTRLTHQTMSTDQLQPRTDEEHIYTALILAGKKLRSADDMENEAQFAPVEHPDVFKFDNILEHHLGKPITHTARVMFEERYMTWYGQNHPEWVDPRRERNYDPVRARRGGNVYSGDNYTAKSPIEPSAVKRWLRSLSSRAAMLRNAIFGPTPDQYKRAAEAMNQSAPSAGGR